MMEEIIANQPQEDVSPESPKIELAYTTRILVLGIVSIFGCWFGIGLIFSIVSLYFAHKAQKLYIQSPEKYTLISFKNKELGKLCAITGISLSGIYLVAWLIKMMLNGFHM